VNVPRIYGSDFYNTKKSLYNGIAPLSAVRSGR